MTTTATFFQIPKALDTDERYKGLSVEARYLYGHMRDTLKLSIKNNWQDGVGFYIRMARVKMAELLHRSLPTVRRIIRELISVGLLKEKREGLTRSNRLYIQLLPGEDEIEFQCRARKTLPFAKKTDFSTDRKPFVPNHTYSDQTHFSETKKKGGYPWFLKNGDVFMKEGELWQFLDNDIEPFYTKTDLLRIADEVMAGI